MPMVRQSKCRCHGLLENDEAGSWVVFLMQSEGWEIRIVAAIAGICRKRFIASKAINEIMRDLSAS